MAATFGSDGANGSLHRIDVETGNPSQESDSVAIGLSGAGIGSASFDVPHNIVYVGAEDGSIYAIAPH